MIAGVDRIRDRIRGIEAVVGVGMMIVMIMIGERSRPNRVVGAVLGRTRRDDLKGEAATGQDLILGHDQDQDPTGKSLRKETDTIAHNQGPAHIKRNRANIPVAVDLSQAEAQTVLVPDLDRDPALDLALGRVQNRPTAIEAIKVMTRAIHCRKNPKRNPKSQKSEEKKFVQQNNKSLTQLITYLVK